MGWLDISANKLKQTYLQGFLDISGQITVRSETANSIETNGGITISRNLSVGGTVQIADETNATTPTSGAVQIGGGIGIAQDAIIGGCLGVRAYDPTYPLTVGSSEYAKTFLQVFDGYGSDAYITNTAYTKTGTTAGSVGDLTNELTTVVSGETATNAYSILSANFIATQGLYVFSDERIKENICNVNYSDALAKFRALQPRTYTYKDTANRGTDTVYGFIAQEVAPHIPNGTSFISDWVPSIYETAFYEPSGRVLTLNRKTAGFLSDGSSCRLRLRRAFGGDLDISGERLNAKQFQLTADISAATIWVDTSGTILQDLSGRLLAHNYTGTKYRALWTQMTDVSGMKIERDVSGHLVMEPYTGTAKRGVFAFGHLVDDYYVLNKEAIWTITAAATREIDRQLQDVSGQLTTAKIQLQDVSGQLTTAKIQLQDVSGQLGIANAKITRLENDIFEIRTNLGI
jgi:hypothetical protein